MFYVRILYRAIWIQEEMFGRGEVDSLLTKSSSVSIYKRVFYKYKTYIFIWYLSYFNFFLLYKKKDYKPLIFNKIFNRVGKHFPKYLPSVHSECPLSGFLSNFKTSKIYSYEYNQFVKIFSILSDKK